METLRSQYRPHHRHVRRTKKLDALIADAESAAFGVGLTPTDFREYSIAEIAAVTNARWDRIAVSRRFADAMNARVCEVIAACAGNKTSLQDFLILPAEKEKTKSNVPEMGDTPEEIEMKLKLLTGSLRAGGYE